jgi:CBS domain-containing protein
MLVSQILKEKGRTVVAVAPTASLAEAAHTLTRNRIGAVLVLDGDARCAGILSERDLVRAISWEGGNALMRAVSSVMTSPVATCEENDTVEELMERMTHGRFRHLPVVKHERVVGIISIGDVVKTRIEETLRETQALKEYIAAS